MDGRKVSGSTWSGWMLADELQQPVSQVHDGKTQSHADRYYDWPAEKYP